MPGTSKREVYKLVNEYIGVSGGYLNYFSYQTHDDFYYQYCGLDISVKALREQRGVGTTRELFIDILVAAAPTDQAAIVQGVLEKCPVEQFPEAEQASEQRLYDYFSDLVSRLRARSRVDMPSLNCTSDVVERALSDAELLLRESGPDSAVDRIHTALHGYLRLLCESTGIELDDDDGLPRLLKRLRTCHPALQVVHKHRDEAQQILGSLATVVDTLNTLRNRASLAHPNEVLLGDAEAYLAIHAARSVLAYVEAKVREPRQETDPVAASGPSSDATSQETR